MDRTFSPVGLDGEPSALADKLFDRLATLTAGLDPVAKDALGVQRYLPEEDIDAKLKQLGQGLWRDLLPPDFKAMYAQERGEWRDRSLLILSDEPFFPWELLWPYQVGARPGETWQDEEPWCLLMKMTRWLRRDARGDGNDAPPATLHFGALACLAPTDSGLASAQDEKKELLDLAKGRGSIDLTPAVPTLSAVMRLLGGGGYDWLHAAAHGTFYQSSAGSDCSLWLQDRQALTPEAIVGPEIEGHILRHRPSFVFNACHGGRQGWAINRLDGWANRFISGGAGLFLAPLWTVRDGNALAFARTFYRELLDGKPVGEAVRHGRMAARREGDPSWLAYSVYSHPNARLKALSPAPKS